jgi:hypothetical protein
MAKGKEKAPMKPKIPSGIVTTNKNIPIAKEFKVPDNIVFSFRFYQEKALFGLDKVDTGWHASLMERLSELSKMDRESFLRDPKMMDNQRYHSINWSHRNIPIQRNEITSMPPTYLNDNENYPLVQFHISKAAGRIIGFWDENRIFNVVLLDPDHNIQPSKRVGYQVKENGPLQSDYVNLLRVINELVESHSLCSHPGCTYKQQISGLIQESKEFGVLYVEPDDLEKIIELVIAEQCTSSEIIGYGLIAYEQDKSQKKA